MNNTWIEVDTSAFRKNLSALRNALSRRTQIMFVVKANAYGHGIENVSRVAASCGVNWFVVSHIEEALAARKAAPNARVLIVGACMPQTVPDLVAKQITPILVSSEHAVSLSEQAAKRNATLTCHVKIDTGMGRLGFDWKTAPKEIRRIALLKHLKLEGVCAHFASAGNLENNFADVQADRFNQVISLCNEAGISFTFKHLSNSAAILRNPEWDLDGVRAGILLYGYGSGSKGGRFVKTQPFLQWKTRILQVKKVPARFAVSYNSTYVTKKPSRLATIDVGYSDGYLRVLSNHGFVLVNGRRCPVVGRITMNLIVVDIGLNTRAELGDEVVLMGTQGKESIWADEIARPAKTIPYEILTGIRTDVRVAK